MKNMLMHDILESSFILNLCLFSIVTFYLKVGADATESQAYLSSISVGIVVLTFTGIIVFHIFLCLRTMSFWKDTLKTSLLKLFKMNNVEI